MLVGITGWIVRGLIAGFIATKIVNLRGDEPELSIGMGAVIGGWLYTAIIGAGVSFLQPAKPIFRRRGRRRAGGLAHRAPAICRRAPAPVVSAGQLSRTTASR
jgi:hypothetical protein